MPIYAQCNFPGLAILIYRNCHGPIYLIVAKGRFGKALSIRRQGLKLQRKQQIRDDPTLRQASKHRRHNSASPEKGGPPSLKGIFRMIGLVIEFDPPSRMRRQGDARKPRFYHVVEGSINLAERRRSQWPAFKPCHAMPATGRVQHGTPVKIFPAFAAWFENRDRCRN